jgi:hypothetical protein
MVYSLHSRPNCCEVFVLNHTNTSNVLRRGLWNWKMSGWQSQCMQVPTQSNVSIIDNFEVQLKSSKKTQALNKTLLHQCLSSACKDNTHVCNLKWQFYWWTALYISSVHGNNKNKNVMLLITYFFIKNLTFKFLPSSFAPVRKNFPMVRFSWSSIL